MEPIGAVTLFLIVWISCLVLITAWKKVYRENNLPPGPTPLPFIGNLLQLKNGGALNSMLALRKKYGDIFTVYLGSRRTIIVCGYNAVKEALIDQGDDFSGRGETPSLDKIYKNYGVAFTKNIARWKQLRRFSLVTMRNFGMGKRSIEDRIQEEVHCLVEELKTKETPIYPRHQFGAASANITCSIMFGDRYDYRDPELTTLLHSINGCFQLMSSSWGQMYDTFPRVMDYIPGPHHQIFRYLEGLVEFTAKKAKMNEETLDPDNPRDYIDCFLIKMKQDNQNASTEFNMHNLLTSTLQIFFAGFDTVTTTLTYAFLILLKYPDVKENMFAEIDRVIGRNRRVAFEDKNNMPYTYAVVQEIQRFITLIPFGVPHSVIRTTQFRGYTIPKDTDVFCMLHTVLRDPEQFSNPEEFNPKNFLNEDGTFKDNDAHMPFSAGKRVCIAKGMANMELFLFISGIVQELDIKPVVELQDLDLTPETVGLGIFPQAYQIRFVPR